MYSRLFCHNYLKDTPALFSFVTSASRLTVLSRRLSRSPEKQARRQKSGQNHFAQDCIFERENKSTTASRVSTPPALCRSKGGRVLSKQAQVPLVKHGFTSLRVLYTYIHFDFLTTGSSRVSVEACPSESWMSEVSFSRVDNLVSICSRNGPMTERMVSIACP